MRRMFRTKLTIIDLIIDCFIWWYRDFLTQVINMVIRILRFIWIYLGLHEVIRKFFTPWKNVNNIAGWFVGIFFKFMYLVIILPIYLIFVIFGIFTILLELAIIPLLILQILVW